MTKNGTEAHQELIIKNRRSIISDGVNHIVDFTDSRVTLDTALGILTIEGEDLKIEDLSKENGRISIVGTVEALYYSSQKAKVPFFKKHPK